MLSAKKLRLYLAVQAKLKRQRQAKKAVAWKHAVNESLFPAQKAFVQSQADAVAALCTRRAGKTHGSGAKLLFKADEKAGSTALYLALTRKSAKNLLWPKLKAMKYEYNIPLSINEADLTATLPNLSKIMLYGADQSNLADRLRGDAYSVVVIDEAASFGENLDYLIEDVLEPALLDYQGQIVLIGTPGTILSGPFYEATTANKGGYDLHSWSLLDNPHLPHALAWIEKLKKRRGWTDDHPTFRREYCGVWTEDFDALVYKYSDEKNGADELPTGHDWTYILAVDLGYEDPAAWGVIAFAESCPEAYIVHTEKHQHWIPEQWAKKTLELQERFRPIETRIDAGALGKPIMIEMQTRWGVPCDAADKREKMATIELMNGDFRLGKLKVLRSNKEYIHQMRILTKDESGQKEDPTLPNDLCDVGCYSYRHARHFLHKEKSVIEYGSEEYWKIEEEKMINAIIAKESKDWMTEME